MRQAWKACRLPSCREASHSVFTASAASQGESPACASLMNVTQCQAKASGQLAAVQKQWLHKQRSGSRSNCSQATSTRRLLRRQERSVQLVHSKDAGGALILCQPACSRRCASTETLPLSAACAAPRGGSLLAAIARPAAPRAAKQGDCLGAVAGHLGEAGGRRRRPRATAGSANSSRRSQVQAPPRDVQLSPDARPPARRPAACRSCSWRPPSRPRP